MSTVTVNGSSSGVTRHGQYFFKGHGMANSPNPAYANLLISDGTISTALAAFLAATPQAMTYDLDGNLTSDGRWGYWYDAENRINWIQATASAVAAGHPNVAFHILYDYLGRRVIKHPYVWSGSSWQTSGAQERYIYNGWNLIARMDDARTGAGGMRPEGRVGTLGRTPVAERERGAGLRELADLVRVAG